jgi:hypothetical protein
MPKLVFGRNSLARQALLERSDEYRSARRLKGTRLIKKLTRPLFFASGWHHACQ